MIALVASHWWLFLIRGVLALALGILMPLFPGAAILTLAIVFGAYALFDGTFAIVAAVRMNHADANWRWLLLEGVLGVGVGILAIVYPGVTALFLVYLFAAWAIVSGAFTIASAIRLRRVVDNEWLMILLGVISVAAGIVIYFVPVAGIFAIVWTISIYAILTGVIFLGLAFRLRKLRTVAA